MVSPWCINILKIIKSGLFQLIWIVKFKIKIIKETIHEICLLSSRGKFFLNKQIKRELIVNLTDGYMYGLKITILQTNKVLIFT